MAVDGNKFICETFCVGERTEFTWKIYDFTASPLRNDTFLCSGVFNHKDTIFWIEFTSSESYMIEIKPLSRTKENLVFSIWLKDSNDQDKYRRHYFIKCGEEQDEAYNISAKVIKDLLVEDCLVIYCEIRSPCITHKVQLFTLQDSLRCSRIEELSNDLSQLYIAKKNSDVIFNVEDIEIEAHSQILSARSTYFATMFKQDMVESRSKKINITDFKAVVIDYLLCYLYTGNLKNLKDLPVDLMMELYTAADKYDVKGLKEMCAQMMMTKLSQNNVEDIAVLAFTHDEQILRDAVVNFFAENTKLIKSDMWIRLEKSCPTLAILVLIAFKK